MHDLLPPDVSVVETAISGQSLESVFPAEESFIRNASEKRRREFAVGRANARQALHQLGIPPVAIPVGEKGQPVWPPGIVGSISHTSNQCIAAVGLANRYRGIGIDAEPNSPLPDGTRDLITCSGDQNYFRQSRDRTNEIEWDTLLFSIKECVFKAWYPATGIWLEFQNVRVSLPLNDSLFVAEIADEVEERSGFPRKISGTFKCDSHTIYSGISIPYRCRA